LLVTRGELLAGVAADLAWGDPQWLPHPVRAIGLWANAAETFWRKTCLPLRLAGGMFWMTVVGATVSIVKTAPRFLDTYWIYSFLACRDLDVHARQVLSSLERGELDEARRRLSFIVGRDTAGLEEREIVRAVIETVAENLSDGVVAPLFYLAIGGPTTMAAYKAINTLDSIVGHRNQRYREFGFVSAKMDDLANLVPARISAVLISCAAAFLPGTSAILAFKTTCRDGRNQPSPNAGYPEAAMAGAVGVQLGGLNFYSGAASRKATLGDPIVELDTRAYKKVRVLLYAVEVIFVAVLCRWVRHK
jgi:adenosylcobinamide-phosphate synthase